MNIIPRRDPTEWAAFNSRFRRLLTGTPTICFWLVVAGSVYGIQKSIEAQHPGLGIAIAFAVAFLVQSINSVSVHFSTRWIASWFLGKPHFRENLHQRLSGIDAFVGLFCIAFTASICYFDFRANKQGSEKAAEQIVETPATVTVDTTAHHAAISAARESVQAAREAEQAERRAYEAGIDRDINQQRARYTARYARLQSLRPQPKWAQNECRQISGILAGLETTRRNRKQEFVPSKSNLAGAQTQLASISAENGRQLLSKQLQADTTNVANLQRTESKRQGFTMAMFFLYMAAMLLWHLCHGMIQYRALRFDEQHPDAENPLVAIAETIKNGIANILWRAKARIMEMLPEDEIHGLTRVDLLAKINTDICHAVYRHILQNPGINEMLIYTGLRNQYPDTAKMREALRLLKTARLVFENSHTWTADANQAAFFTANQPPVNIFDPNTFAAFQ